MGLKEDENMRSNNETPMLERFWDGKGTLIREFTLVQGDATRETRRIDGVILPDVKFLRLLEGTSNDFDYRKLSMASRQMVRNALKGSEVWAVQVKCSQLGLALLGQCLFSKLLLLVFQPKRIRCFALCGASPHIMRRLARFDGIELVVDGTFKANGKPPMGKEPRLVMRLDRALITSYWKTVVRGGTLILNYPVTDDYRAHGLILLDGKRRLASHEEFPIETLKNQRVVVLTTRRKLTRRPGMYTLGWAHYMSVLLRNAGANCVASVIPCCREDSAFTPLLELKKFSRLEFWSTKG